MMLPAFPLYFSAFLGLYLPLRVPAIVINSVTVYLDLVSYSSVKSLLSQGVSRPTMYQVIIPRIGVAANDQIELLCKATSVPEMSVTTLNANGHDAQGVVRYNPAHMTYAQPFSITIISDRDYTVYRAMKGWLNTITTNSNPIAGGAIAAQKANYYDAIKSTITLRKLENNGKVSDERPGRQEERGAIFSPFLVRFNNAYPVRMGELALASDAYDSYMEFQVDFSYENYTFVE